MDVLILGGTEFLGWHIARAYTAAGHRVTLFNRGLRPAKVPSGCELLIGDRTGDLSGLRGRCWDVAVDTSGYLPRFVSNSAFALCDGVGSYVFVSTISVFESPGPLTREDSGTSRLTQQQEAEADLVQPPVRSEPGGGYGAAYGALKARCESVVQELMPARTLVLRPGFIIGPNDYSNRFPYWVERALRGGLALAPGEPGRRIRLIDARDIADWLVGVTAAGRHGVFNLTGADGVSMGDLLQSCSRLGGAVEWRWLPDEALLAEGVRPFADLPYWLPAAENGVLEVPNDAAVEAGLRFRSLAESATDTARWRSALPASMRATGGLDPAKERAVLAAARGAAPGLLSAPGP